MENEQLPPELEQLERDLADRPRPDPPAELRQRVIGGVRAELQRNGARNGWTFAAAVATAALVWLNLSLSATLATDCGPQPDSLAPEVGKVAEQIQQLLPELSEREALRQAILLQAGSSQPWCPSVPVGPAAPRHRGAGVTPVAPGEWDDLLLRGE
jgi:hypothetical protein